MNGTACLDAYVWKTTTSRSQSDIPASSDWMQVQAASSSHTKWPQLALFSVTDFVIKQKSHGTWSEDYAHEQTQSDSVSDLIMAKTNTNTVIAWTSQLHFVSCLAVAEEVDTNSLHLYTGQEHKQKCLCRKRVLYVWTQICWYTKRK